MGSSFAAGSVAMATAAVAVAPHTTSVGQVLSAAVRAEVGAAADTGVCEGKLMRAYA